MERERLPQEYSFLSRPYQSAFERFAIVDDGGVIFMSTNRAEILHHWRLLTTSNPYDINILGSASLVHIHPGQRSFSRMAG